MIGVVYKTTISKYIFTECYCLSSKVMTKRSCELMKELKKMKGGDGLTLWIF